MKKASLIVVFWMIAAGAAYAGARTGRTQPAFSLPQPCTLLLCTGGLLFFNFLTKTKKIP